MSVYMAQPRETHLKMMYGMFWIFERLSGIHDGYGRS